MNNDKLELIISDFISIMPLFQKKLIKQGCGFDHNARFNHSQFQIMLVLKEQGECPISDVAKRLLISTPNMTKLLNKLIDEGMINRVHDNKDRRIVNISLTDEGNKFLDERFNLVKISMKGNLSSLSNNQIDKLYDSLSTLKDVLSEIKTSE
ncbi:MarR family winged helix-turn-helix transcriptional regulator [Romboutsia sp.]|uniref:MarR family winged helix-turn-helix transcriptional regulator n=1 Tax=Romboutsia sp. TaxID=1965302 RepID=UPI003F314760